MHVHAWTLQYYLYLALLHAGVVFIYASLLLSLFSFFHILSVFWAVMFPFHARSFRENGYLKYVHLSMLVLALVLPWGPVSASFVFGFNRFPAVTCFPAMDGTVIRYGMIWPCTILIATSLSLTVLILWVVIKLVRKKRKKQGARLSVSGFISSINE